MDLGYHHALRVVRETSIDLTTMKGWNTINRILDNNLAKTAYLKEVASYLRFGQKSSLQSQSRLQRGLTKASYFRVCLRYCTTSIHLSDAKNLFRSVMSGLKIAVKII